MLYLVFRQALTHLSQQIYPRYITDLFQSHSHSTESSLDTSRFLSPLTSLVPADNLLPHLVVTNE